MDVHVAGINELDLQTLYGILKLRAEVFIVEQESAYLDPDGLDLAPTTQHLWIAEEDQIVAYLRLTEQPGNAVRIGRVCVAEDRRGRGLADALMLEALRVIGDNPSWLHAQTPVCRFYQRHGFSVSGPEFMEDGIAHLPMARDVTQ